MKDGCLDIGTLQAFMDGELSHPECSRVSGHIAHCDVCAAALSSSEEESALVFSMIGREFDTLVPTQRLWNKINDSLEGESNRRSFWTSIKSYLSAAVASPSLAGAVGLVLLVTIFTTFWLQRTLTTPGVPDIASTRTAAPINTSSLPPDINNSSAPFIKHGDVAVDDAVKPRQREAGFEVSIERAAYHPERRQPALNAGNSSLSSNGYLPGEEGYIKTISTLEKTVADQKEGVLRPSERVEYERDMAMVNDTINRLRTEAKKNPRNSSIKQVLYSSYQNKIDLLNAVSDKEELVATLK